MDDLRQVAVAMPHVQGPYPPRMPRLQAALCRLIGHQSRAIEVYARWQVMVVGSDWRYEHDTVPATECMRCAVILHPQRVTHRFPLPAGFAPGAPYWIDDLELSPAPAPPS